MKLNPWTLGLAAAGIVSVGSIQAEEAGNQVLTSLSSTVLSGYVDTSAIWRIGNGRDPVAYRAFQGPAKQDGFNLEVVSVNLEKPLDEGQWSAGYNVNLLFGPNAVGFNPSFLGLGADDVSLMNTYVALRAPVGNGLDLKIGTFDKIIGYEHFHSHMNPNFSRSYGYTLGPNQNTGVLASYQINDSISISAGVANTINSVLIANPGGLGASETQKTYMGAVRYIADENLGALAGMAVEAGIVDGRGLGNTQDTTWYYGAVTVPTPLEGLAVGAAYDYREDAAPGGSALAPANPLGGGDNWAWAAAGYLSYQATEKLKANARVEYLNGSNGTLGFVEVPADSVEIGALTVTLDYSLWDNVISRAEFRWDHSFGNSQPFGINDENALTLAANFIYRF